MKIAWEEKGNTNMKELPIWPVREGIHIAMEFKKIKYHMPVFPFMGK